MGEIMRSFRSKMVLLFGLSMLLSGLVTYLIFKGLQYYYHTMVQYEDPMAQFRIFLGRFGDFNLFFILFILLSFLFSFSLRSPILLILMRFPAAFVILLEVIFNTRCISSQMMNSGILRWTLIWQVKNCRKQLSGGTFRKAARINWLLI